MGRPEPTYVFENGRAYALVNGQVVAAADDVGELEDQFVAPEEEAPQALDGATHIETPNGLKGQILGRVADVWGDQVTVRFENGNIVRLPVVEGMTFTAEKAPQGHPIEDLQQRLDAIETPNLQERKTELEEIKHEARVHLTKGAALSEEEDLHRIVVQAEYELGEVSDALEHLRSEEAQAFTPPTPFEHVVEQESVGGGKADWLDRAVSDMIAEAEQVDYGQLLDEGPEAFTAELDDAVLSDGGAVRQMASSFIRSKTAHAEAEVRDRYETAWLARIEACRRTQLANRKTTTQKEAAAHQEEFDSLSDDSLFL